MVSGGWHWRGTPSLHSYYYYYYYYNYIYIYISWKYLDIISAFFEGPLRARVRSQKYFDHFAKGSPPLQKKLLIVQIFKRR